MLSCTSLDPLVTPFIDNELPPADRDAVTDHLRVCPPCHSRVSAERAVRDLIRTKKPALNTACASEALRTRCAALARGADAGHEDARSRDAAAGARLIPHLPTVPEANVARGLSQPGAASSSRAWTPHLKPLALAASLVLVIGGAFVYEATEHSTRVMAAELAADHVKCLTMNAVLGTDGSEAAVERSLLDHFGWRVHLPEDAASAGLELVGTRPCLYGEGRIAHIMYKHQGRPVSLFMLPNAVRSRDLVEVLGHEAAIWCVGNRTFVLVAREPRKEVEQMASFVQASLR